MSRRTRIELPDDATESEERWALRVAVDFRAAFGDRHRHRGLVASVLYAPAGWTMPAAAYWTPGGVVVVRAWRAP